ncbi:MAG: hypothetical protein V7K89_00005, partial [Nostoc sp.]
LNSIYNFELYVVLVQSEVFRDRLAKLSFKSHSRYVLAACERKNSFTFDQQFSIGEKSGE